MGATLISASEADPRENKAQRPRVLVAPGDTDSGSHVEASWCLA